MLISSFFAQMGQYKPQMFEQKRGFKGPKIGTSSLKPSSRGRLGRKLATTSRPPKHASCPCRQFVELVGPSRSRDRENPQTV